MTLPRWAVFACGAALLAVAAVGRARMEQHRAMDPRGSRRYLPADSPDRRPAHRIDRQARRNDDWVHARR